MKKNAVIDLKLALILAIIGQLVFFIISPGVTEVSYSSRIYATTGVKHKQEDLHKLNEAAHYFGQTIIGWLKFPNFMNELSEAVQLPETASISAHVQERQNLIFTLDSAEPVAQENLKQVQAFIQTKIDEYNDVSQTEFILTNFDYEHIKKQRSYGFGALVTLLVSLAVASAISFLRHSS